MIVQDTFGNVLLVGRTSEGELNTVDDDTFTSAVTSDFVAVKLQGTSGDVLWTWEDTSIDGADWMVAAGTDSNNDVRAHARDDASCDKIHAAQPERREEEQSIGSLTCP